MRRAPTPTPSCAATASSTRRWCRRASRVGGSVVNIASQYLGYRYTWGGTAPSTGFDCSGFTYYIYRQAGQYVPRDLWGQVSSGSRIARADLQPGDLVFFQNTYMA